MKGCAFLTCKYHNSDDQRDQRSYNMDLDGQRCFRKDELILMRLSDAIAETAPLARLSPHRSWWTAENGVSRVIRKDGKLIITLKTGQSVPVSRNKAKAVKEAGWI